MSEQTEPYVSKAKQPSKKEWANTLLLKLHAELEKGQSPEQALETLTLRQYDFLIDYGIDLDEFVLTAEQRQNITALMKQGAGRPTFPNGYDKKYPKHKVEIYNSISDFLSAQGAEITARHKPNFRDIDFTLNGEKYKIVLSMPRT